MSFACVWLQALLLLVFKTLLWGADFPAIRFQTSDQSRSLGASVFIYIDSSKSLTIADVSADLFVQKFKPSHQDIPNFGFAQPTFWCAFSVQNTIPNVNDWLLEVAYQPLDSIEVFEFVNAKLYRRLLVGDMLPYSQRLMNTRTYIIPLNLADSVPHTFYFRINTQSSVQIPILAHRSRTLSEDLATTGLGYGIFFGVMAALIVYNLFLYISLGSNYYLYYILYLSGALLYIAVVNGFAAQYMWGDYPWWANYMNIGSIGLMVTGMSVFARNFLLVKHYAPGMAKMLMATTITGIGLILFGLLLPYRVGVMLGVVVNLATIGIVVASGAIVWKRGSLSVRYFFLAAALFLTGNILFVMKTLGALPTNPFTSHVAEIGVMVEGLLFAFALADRYRQIRMDREQAQQEALRIEHESNLNLERKVRERTAELEALNDEMQRQMVILNDQAVEIEMTNVELQEKNLQLENLNHEKNEFMGIAVHDLKNPLQTIIMNTSMMRRYRERMDNEQRDYLFERIEETTRRMHDIITNLLDANAIEMGKVELNITAFPIVKEISALVDDYVRKAEAKKISLRFHSTEEEIYAFADKHRTLEVVENLLSNAVKFSPLHKEITVTLSLEDLAVPIEIDSNTDTIPNSQETFIRIDVQDQGPGLSTEDKVKLFGKFARLSAKPTAGEHSTGLGLSIVKRFVELMGGHIQCTSELGHGATFTIFLPTRLQKS